MRDSRFYMCSWLFGSQTLGRLGRVLLWSPGYRLCLSFQLITTTDGKKVSAACPHHWGRGACWGSFSDVSIPKKSTLYTSCTDEENGCRFGPDLDGLCPYVCSKPRPTMLPVSCFKLFSSVASCTPRNNHHQCHMVWKIKDPSFEYISSWLFPSIFAWSDLAAAAGTSIFSGKLLSLVIGFHEGESLQAFAA